jgi:ubiquinone/menaquinone biosynthesis C-methylase UbiE
MLFVALCFFLTAAAMIWSSKLGKLRQREIFIDSLDLKGTELILDVGCGCGLLLNAAARRLTLGKAIGLDLWQSQDLSGNNPERTLANAKIEGVLDRVEVRTGDMRQMPFSDASIDVVVSSIAIHNVPDKDGRKQTILEIDRVLKSGGKLGLIDLRCIDEYISTLESLGWRNLQVSKPSYWRFPPIRVIRGVKK